MRTNAFSTHDDARSRVLEATDIVVLIGQSVRLKERGKDYIGLCPFHQEKTASFHVTPSKQRFYCYGCKKGGNAIDFVMERDRVEFKDALRFLAEAANIELPAFKASKEGAGERQILFDAHSVASLFFEKLLAHPAQGEVARKYLEGRGFNAEAVQKFHIGYVPEGWDALLKSPGMKKFTPQQLALAGLAKPRNTGEGYYDTFRNRLMFPIRDETGRVIAFGGRVMPGSEDPAKYLNSPETPLFSKSRCLYGLDLARPKIVETRVVAIVEGYTDVVMAHQFGCSNVVAVLGTGLTEQHVTMLRRFADRIVLLFDADRAGDSAVNRAVELFLTQPIEIKIASLPDGMDPDEFLLKNGAEAFNSILAGASDALDYKWRQLDQRLKGNDSLTDRQQAVTQYLQLLAGARASGTVDALRWHSVLARVSRLTEIPADELNKRFKVQPVKQRDQAQVAEASEPTIKVPAGPPTAHQRAEEYILGLLLNEPDRWHDIQQHVHLTDFTDDDLHKIAEIYWRHQRDEGEPILNELLTLLDEGRDDGIADGNANASDLKSIAVRCSNEASVGENPDEMLAGCIQFLLGERRRSEEQKHVADLRRTDGNNLSAEESLSADIDTLRKLQEKARQPDMKRVKF